MTSANGDAARSAGEPTAGALLRRAREAQGLHLETLAQIVKIPARKLQALEEDRYDELHDASFTRALTQTICRALKLDPQTVLARLPQGRQYAIEKVSQGLNTPFRERELRPDAVAGALIQRPVVWVALLLVLAAAVLFLLPMRVEVPEALSVATGNEATTASNIGAPAPGTITTEPVPPATEPAPSAPQVVVDTVHSAPAVEPAASGSEPAVSPAALVLHANAETWVEVVDRKGQALLSRTLAAGDSVGIDGDLPMRVKIGNASGTVLTFRGETVDLAAVTRDNVARLELR